ncbi:MAG: glycosyltransferase family 4 protein [Ignavibacteriales bacterium]
MKIINLGTYPPPFGGVSIHIKRLAEYLSAHRVSNMVIDISGSRPAEKIGKNIKLMTKRSVLSLIFHKKSIIHAHNYSIGLLITYFILSFRHYVILSFHNERFIINFSKNGKLIFRVYKLLVNCYDKIVVDSEKCRELAGQLINDKDKLAVIPEFISPEIIPPIKLKLITDIRKQHQYIISSNAFQLSFFEGKDLYGVDLLIELANRLRNLQKMDVAFLFLLPNIGDKKYYEELVNKLRCYNLEERFFFLTDMEEHIKEASSIWNISDVIIRATNTDGNSLTIWEALSLQVPVIASDCVERPKGTILFKNRDIDDLTEKTSRVLLNIKDIRDGLRAYPIKNNADEFLQLYDSFK